MKKNFNFLILYYITLFFNLIFNFTKYYDL